MMTKTFEKLHPMACRCRACRAPHQSANIAQRPTWRLHPIAKAILACCAFWVFIGALVALVWGAWQ